MSTLDDELHGSPPPNVIKLDVEGLELAVLQGADGLLRDQGPVLLFELWLPGLERAGASGEALLGYLGQLGYRLWLLDEVDISARSLAPTPLLRRVSRLRNQIGLVVAAAGRPPGWLDDVMCRGKTRFHPGLVFS